MCLYFKTLRIYNNCMIKPKSLTKKNTVYNNCFEADYERYAAISFSCFCYQHSCRVTAFVTPGYYTDGTTKVLKNYHTI